MDNCGSPHWSTTSAVDELKFIRISTSSDSDDSDIAEFYYSDSEPESSSSTVFPVKYKLPQRNHTVINASTNRTLMDRRMAASNRSIRMKHGTTALDIMVPLNRETTTRPLESGTTQHNLTTPLNSATAQRDKTTKFRKPALVPASSSQVPAQWMLPFSSSSLTVPRFYSAQVPIPTSRPRPSAPPYSFPPPYITPSNMPKTSKFSKRSQYTIPPYVPPYSCPPYPTQSSMPVYTSFSSSLIYASQSSTTSNTSQTSTSSKRPQSSASTYSPRYVTPTDSMSSSVSTYTSWSPTSTYNFTSPSPRMNPRSAHYSASPSYSHYTFPRSSHYTMPVSGTYCTVMPQSSTQDSNPSSVYEPSINVWPTEIGSVMQASMENIQSVLAIQMQNALQPSTAARADLISRRVNDQSLKCINSKPSGSTKATSNSWARNYSKQSEDKLMPLYNNDSEKRDTHCEIMQHELQSAWVYFNKLEIVDIKPNGEIKCICPAMKFEDLLKSSINEKRMLVNLYQHYKTNNLLFETTYDYNSSPQETIVSQNIENTVLQWLIFLQMEEYDWFFNSLSLIEIENINPMNIQKFIMRSKSNKTISLEDQLKICCLIKKIKERLVSLVTISMNLREKRIDEESFMSTVKPYITEVFLFPMSVEHFMFDDIMKESIIITIIELKIYLSKALNMDTQTDTNSTVGDIEMVASKETWKYKRKICYIR